MPPYSAKESAYEKALLERATLFREYGSLPSLNHAALQLITKRHGVDFATALLFDRFTKSPGHSQFISRINLLRATTPFMPPKIDARIVIVPGALYEERPDMGGDGRIIRELADDFGLQTDLIPLASLGSVRNNAALIANWLRKHKSETMVLVSLSKGGTDLKMALSEPNAFELFPNIRAWINVCGPLHGSQMANWILESPLRTFFFRCQFRFQKRDFQFITDLRRDRNGGLNSKIEAPSHVKMLSLIGFPLQGQMTTRLSRFCHRTLARFGPNDGTTLLADLHHVQGEIYPAWGMDHYFRPASEAKKLIGATLRYLAEGNS